MLDDSLFISATVHEREVELPDGKKHKMWFKELPATEFRRLALARQSGDEERQIQAEFRLIAESLCEPDGKPAITLERAMSLKAEVLSALMAVINEINTAQGNG